VEAAMSYWLGTDSAEVAHLTAQAEVYAREADELLDRIAPAPGSSAIDVGCGVLGILPQLRRRAGGRVVGLDIEPGLLAQVPPGIETVEADARATGLPGESFDLVHARTLLINVPEPESVVAELTRLARPGGIVALQEPDAAAWVCDPPHPEFDRLRDAVIAAYPRTGRDFLLGRRVGRLLRDAGLLDVRVRATARVTEAGDYYHTFLLTLAGLLRLDGHGASLSEHLERPGTLTCMPLLWQAWGAKPPAAAPSASRRPRRAAPNPQPPARR
jgi:SAM-dependent methyltransferase